MYVCICNGYRDSEIRDMARNGVRCARAAYNGLGNGPNCGTCLPAAQEIIDGVHGESGGELTLPHARVAAE